MRAQKPTVPPVSYRLDSHHQAQLKKLSEAYEISPNQYARQLLIEALDDAERFKIRDRLTAIEGELVKLRRDVKSEFAGVVEVLLMAFNSTEPMTEEQIHAYVKQNFGS
jgi:hypothetical protein